MKTLTQGHGRTSILVPSMSYIMGECGITLNSTAPFWLTVKYYYEAKLDGKDWEEEPVPEYVEIGSAITQSGVIFQAGREGDGLLTFSVGINTEMIGMVDDRTYDNLVKLLSQQAKAEKYSDPDLARPAVNERIKRELGFKMIQEEYEY